MSDYETTFKDIPWEILLFLLVLFVSTIYYFFYDFFTNGLFKHYGNTFETLSMVEMFLLIILLSIIGINLFLILTGFIHREKWTRRFTMFFLICAALWPIWGLTTGSNLMTNIVTLLIYLILILVISSKFIVKYFKNVIFKIGDYTLYRLYVTLKSGMTLPIYFFSKRKPRSGETTLLPEGYRVYVNKRSKMPYLKKIRSTKQKKCS